MVMRTGIWSPSGRNKGTKKYVSPVGLPCAALMGARIAVVLPPVHTDERNEFQCDLHLPSSTGPAERRPDYRVCELWMSRLFFCWLIGVPWDTAKATFSWDWRSVAQGGKNLQSSMRQEQFARALWWCLGYRLSERRASRDQQFGFRNQKLSELSSSSRMVLNLNPPRPRSWFDTSQFMRSSLDLSSYPWRPPSFCITFIIGPFPYRLSCFSAR